MKLIPVIVISFITVSCNMEYKHAENDVQGYKWLGVNGNEEIKNDTIYSYDGKIGDDNFTYRIIKNVTDSTITYQYYDNESVNFPDHIASYKQKMIDDNQYLIIYYEASVSMFTRKRVCPINFQKMF